MVRAEADATHFSEAYSGLVGLLVMLIKLCREFLFCYDYVQSMLNCFCLSLADLRFGLATRLFVIAS